MQIHPEKNTLIKWGVISLVLLITLTIASILITQNPSDSSIPINKTNQESYLLTKNELYKFAKVTDNDHCYLYLLDGERTISLPDYTDSKIDCEMVFRVKDYVIYRSKPIDYVEEISNPVIRSTIINYYNIETSKKYQLYDSSQNKSEDFQIIALDSTNEKIFVLSPHRYQLFDTSGNQFKVQINKELNKRFSWDSIDNLATETETTYSELSSLKIIDASEISTNGNKLQILLKEPISIMNQEYKYIIEVDTVTGEILETITEQ